MRKTLIPLVAWVHCAHPVAPSVGERLHTGARRVVEVQVEAHLAPTGRVAEGMDARATILPGGGESRRPLAPGRCEPIGATRMPRSVAPVGDLTLGYGIDTVLPFDGRAGAFVAEGVEVHRELAWQPMSLHAKGKDLSLQLNGAVQFPDVPRVVESVGDESHERYRWIGADGSTEAELRVEGRDGAWRCGVAGSTFEVPASFATLEDRRLSLVVSRSERHLLPDGTLVLGRAAFVLPVVPEALQAHEPAPLAPGLEEGEVDRVGLPRSWWRHSGRSFRDQRPA